LLFHSRLVAREGKEGRGGGEKKKPKPTILLKTERKNKRKKGETIEFSLLPSILPSGRKGGEEAMNTSKTEVLTFNSTLLESPRLEKKRRGRRGKKSNGGYSPTFFHPLILRWQDNGR